MHNKLLKYDLFSYLFSFDVYFVNLFCTIPTTLKTVDKLTFLKTHRKTPDKIEVLMKNIGINFIFFI